MENSFPITIDGREIELTPDNHGIAMFRFEPEYDYLDVQEQLGPTEEETRHTLVFRHRWMCIWMGRIAMGKEDKEILDEIEEAHGPFFAQTGWLSRVMVEDRASEFEKEMFVQSMLSDLNRAESPPKEWDED